MRLNEKVTYIRAKLRWLAMDMEHWAGLATLAETDPKYKAYKASTEEHLLAFKNRLLRELDRMDDPKACPSDSKGIYFCELEKGHDGMHREDGLGWND